MREKEKSGMTFSLLAKNLSFFKPLSVRHLSDIPKEMFRK